ncbi:hypothetical protein [Mesorhizobium sp. M5C.F.Cr.IN.023.01.1.1]|uniref:hypothetical protein n=1 Tax=Mesorhizobium sp. M5C.F.Cr.IN.023.01.1.1 TaxID=2496768 RepID=UPI001FDED2B3|nr:hypothetical protein [Mesorhizobium sp. M5C.F.Cr.IN.023.01.1.1]
MPDFAHIVTSFVNDPLASLLLAIPLSFALIAFSAKIWWIHGPLAVLLQTVSIFFHDQRHLALDSFGRSFRFPAALPGRPQSAPAVPHRDLLVLCFRADSRRHLRRWRSSTARHSDRQAVCRSGAFSSNHQEDHLT